MPLHPLFGHDGVQSRLAAAVAANRLPQALLFEGPRGVGKQRLALWLAQSLVCEQGAGGGGGGEEGGACGDCRSCRLVNTLQHPDVHWFVPLEPSKKGADADKQVDLVAEALAEEMTARREQPLYAAPSGLASHAIAAVRLLLRRMALTPALARRKVFIVGDAERLIPQRGAEDAANALLKALEEPPADTVFVLTAADPEALLPTVLSRVVRVRVARIADSVVTVFAQQVLRINGKVELAQRVSAAEGCIGRLLATEGDAGAGSRRAADLSEAVQKGAAARYALALSQMPFQARGGFTEMLDALAGRLRAEAKSGGATQKLIEAIARVMDARELAQGNVNPQLVTAVLAEDLVGRS
jgi:DNA polymerase-3 subunit delta'